MVLEKSKRIIKPNKSLHFLIPMIGITYAFYKNNILNSYLMDKQNRPELNDFHLFILVRARDSKLEIIKEYKEWYQVDEGYMYVFRIPSDFEEDYLRFILGEYSQFTSLYKQHLLRLIPAPYTASTVFKVITKSSDAKAVIEEKVGMSIGEQEVFSVPNFSEECYE